MLGYGDTSFFGVWAREEPKVGRRKNKPPVFFNLRGKSSRNDFLREAWLFKWLFSFVEEGFLYTLCRPT
jgi:hypothetical protein